MLREKQPKEKPVGKLAAGFVLGFLACVWTYGLNPTEAMFGFGYKVAAAHEHLQTEYRTDPSLGHKGQYSNHNRNTGFQPTSGEETAAATLAHRDAYWLSRAGGAPPM